MSLTAEEREAILSAQKMALEALNAQGEFVYPIQQNLDIVRDELIRQGVPVAQWLNLSIWISAIVGCKADGKLIQRPTRAEYEARLHSQDRFEGSRKALAESKRQQSQKNNKSEVEQATEWAKTSLEMLRDPTKFQKKQEAEKAEAEATFNSEQRAIMESLPTDLHFSIWSQEQRRQFMKLTPANIRRFNLKQAAYQRQHQHESD